MQYRVNKSPIYFLTNFETLLPDNLFIKVNPLNTKRRLL